MEAWTDCWLLSLSLRCWTAISKVMQAFLLRKHAGSPSLSARKRGAGARGGAC